MPSTDFSPRVDEFIADLEEFAAGSYLKESERANWDEPFDPAVLPRLRGLLLAFLPRLEQATEEDRAVAELTGFYTALGELNEETFDALIEPEELASIEGWIEEILANNRIEFSSSPRPDFADYPFEEK